MTEKKRTGHDDSADLRKRAEEALWVKDWAIESAINAIVTSDLEGNLNYVNPAFLKLWGYSSPAEVLGKPAVGFWQMGEKAAEVMEAVLTKGGWIGELVAQGKDGALFDVHVASSMVVDVTGRPVCMQASFADIADRKRAEKSLRTMVEMLEAAPNAITVHDFNGKFLYANRKSIELHGYETDEFMALNLHDLDVPESEALIAERMQLIKEKGEASFEVAHIRKDGTTFPLDAFVKLVEWHGISAILSINTDITERKRTEAYREMGREVLQILNQPGDLQDSIQRVLAALKTRTGFDAAGIRLQDGDDFPYFVQKGFSKDFLLTENMLIERAADGGVCRDKDGNVSLECTCGLIISGKTDPTNPYFTQGGSCWTNDEAGTPFQDTRLHPRDRCLHDGFQSVALVPIRNKDRIIGLIQLNDRRKGRFTLNAVEILEGIASHIGEALMRRRAESQREAALEETRQKAKELQEKNDELTRFTYAVSHDLRSPLVTIQTFQGYLERDIRSQDAARMEKDLGYIRNAADKMSRLLNELLRLSRVGSIMNPFEEAPLQAIVKEALDLGAGRITARGVRVDLTEEPVVLYGDRTRLVEVFQNLVDNAAKFMGDQPAPRVEIGVKQAGEELVLHVRDNGIGIDPELQPLVFGLFHKLDPDAQGEGIGLALVKRIVEVHGGRIWVESEGPGKGTTFRFTLAKTRRLPR
jgi:PAS domain S-box-containing protein